MKTLLEPTYYFSKSMYLFCMSSGLYCHFSSPCFPSLVLWISYCAVSSPPPTGVWNLTHPLAHPSSFSFIASADLLPQPLLPLATPTSKHTFLSLTPCCSMLALRQSSYFSLFFSLQPLMLPLPTTLLCTLKERLKDLVTWGNHLSVSSIKAQGCADLSSDMVSYSQWAGVYCTVR